MEYNLTTTEVVMENVTAFWEEVRILSLIVCSKYFNIFSFVNLVFILIGKKVRMIIELVALGGKLLLFLDQLQLGSDASLIGLGAQQEQGVNSSSAISSVCNQYQITCGELGSPAIK